MRDVRQHPHLGAVDGCDRRLEPLPPACGEVTLVVLELRFGGTEVRQQHEVRLLLLDPLEHPVAPLIALGVVDSFEQERELRRGA